MAENDVCSVCVQAAFPSQELLVFLTMFELNIGCNLTLKISF